jgi:hypothetical protein
LAIIGSASIQIRADDKFFEADVQRAVKRIKNVAIQLKADVDLTKASKKIRDLRYRITSKDAVLKIDANVAKAEEKLARLLAKFIDKDLNFNVVANTQGANTALRQLDERYRNRRIPFTAQADTAAARAQLAWAARNRSVGFTAHLDPSTRRALQGMFNTLTGTLPFEKIKGAITGMAANFEGLAVKGSAAVAVIGNLAAEVLTLGANILSIGGDVTQLVGLAALLPAAFGSMASMMVVNKMAWNDFGDALTGTGKKASQALAKLNPIAKEAVLGLKGTWTAIQKPVQNAFWTKMGTSLQDTVHKLLPSLKTGLSGIASSMGGLTRETLLAFGKLSDGTLNKMMGNLAKGLSNLQPAVQPFIGALNTLGEVGTTYLPQFGTYLADASKHFASFIDNAEKTGQINVWIETGVKRLQELGSIAKSTAGFFTGLTNAARMSGAPGLTEMAAGMENLAAVANDEPFRSRLVAILEGAREGAEKLGAGFRTLTDFVSKSAPAIGLFLSAAGRVGQLTFENITGLFDGTGLGSGLMDAVGGLGDAMELMKPGFKDLGSLLGDLGEIAGEVLRNMAPGLNQLFSTLGGVIAGFKDGVMNAMPVFNEFIQAMMGLASGPIVALAETLGNLLTGFSQLPGGIQTVIMSIGLFLLLKPKLMNMFTGFAASASSAFKGLATTVDSEGNRTSTAFGKNMDKIKTAWGSVSTAFNNPSVGNGPVRQMDRIAAGAGQVRSALGTTANQGLRGAANGAIGLLGGPWGAALAVAAVGIGIFAEHQANAKAEVDALAGALNQQTGAFTSAGKGLVMDKVMDVKANWWDDFNRLGQKNMKELVAATHMNMTDVANTLGDPKGRDEYLKNWDALVNAAGEGNDVTDQMAASVHMTKEQFAGLSEINLQDINGQMKKGAELAKQAEEKVKGVADAMQVNTIVAGQLSKNYDILSDSTSSADAKFGALKQNLDLLNGSQLTARASSRDYQQSLANTGDEIKRLVTENHGVIDSTGKIDAAFRNTLVNAKGQFSDATQGSRDFSIAMESSADAILKQGTNALQLALQAGDSLPDAQAKALAAMDAPMGAMRANLSKLGFDTEQVNGIMKSLGLDPDKLKGALSVDTAKAQIDIARTALAADAFSKGNYTAVLAALPDEAKKKIGEATGTAELFAKGDYEGILKVLDETPGKREAALAAFLSYDGTEWWSYLKAHNLIPDEVLKANKDVEGLIPEKTLQLKAQDNAKPILDGLNAYILGDKNSKLTVDDQITAVLARVNGSPLTDKDSQLTTRDLVSGVVDQVNSKEMKGKLNTLQTSDLVSHVMDIVNAKTLNGKSNTLTTKDLASIVVHAANEVVLKNKENTLSTTVRTIFQTLGQPPSGIARAAGPQAAEQANGGVWSGGGIQRFANGGFSQAVKAFARGGRENHVAQIARGAWPARVWAEPETGGEAYIPLSKAKRPRSLKILEEVAKTFGMSLFKMSFANGGTTGGSPASSAGSSFSAASNGKVPAALLSSISHSLLNNGGGLNNIGQNIVDGIIGGVNNRRGDAVVAMENLSDDLENTVRTKLDIHSPSKAFLALGRYIVDGLAVGIKTNAGIVYKNMDTLINRIYMASSDVAKATGRSTASSLALLRSQRTLSAEWSKIAPKTFTDAIVDYYQKTGSTGNRTLADIVRARDDVTFRLGQANERLKTQNADYANTVKDVSSKMNSEFKLGTNILSDSQPYVPKMKFEDVKTYATGVLGRLRSFNSKLQKLRKAGVAPALINEVAQLGSAEGSAMADALLDGSSKDIQGLNADVAAIAGISNQIGVSTADGMYKAGLDATKGLVAGLLKDQSSLTQAATQISNRLINTVKSTLGIRSPSRVFAQLGRYTTEGYIVGLDQMQPVLDQRVSALVNPSPRRSSFNGFKGATGTTPAVAPTAQSAAAPTIVTNVYPSQGLNETQVANSVSENIYWRLSTKI